MRELRRQWLLRVAALPAALACSSSSPGLSPGDAETDARPEILKVPEAGTAAHDAMSTRPPPKKTKDLSDAFFIKMRDNCARLHCNPMEILRVWSNESRVSAAAWNTNGNASGLCQLMPNNLAAVGWTRTTPDGKPDHKAFRALPADVQVDYAFKFYSWFQKSLVSETNDYVATFLPADLSLPEIPTVVLCSHYIPPPDRLSKFPWAYDANKGFDPARKGDIQRIDLDHAITRACVGERWAEVEARMKAVM
jgi:hypothetical protein